MASRQTRPDRHEEEQDSSFAQDELFKLDSLNLDNILNFGRELVRGGSVEYNLAALDPQSRLAHQKKTLNGRLGLLGRRFEDEEMPIVIEKDPSPSTPHDHSNGNGLSRSDSNAAGQGQSTEESGLSSRQLNVLKRKRKREAQKAAKGGFGDLSIRRTATAGSEGLADDTPMPEAESKKSDYFSLERPADVDEDTKVVSEMALAVKKEEEQDSSFAQDELFKLDSLNLDNILNFGRELVRGGSVEYNLAALDPQSRLAHQKKTLNGRLGLLGRRFEDEEMPIVIEKDPSPSTPHDHSNGNGLSRSDSNAAGQDQSTEESGLSTRQLNVLKRKRKREAQKAAKGGFGDLSIRRTATAGSEGLADDTPMPEAESKKSDYFSLERPADVDEDTKVVSEFKGPVLPIKSELEAEDTMEGTEWPHRALVFCQMKEMLDMVQNTVLKSMLPSVSFLRLDGGVEANKRQAIVNKFNQDPSYDVLLLTTSVGGLGLNLTGADTVIFVEHDWNPQKDLQAMDRAHRIGQKKVVNVYRLITRGTLEEKILSLQRFKIDVASTVVNQQNAGLSTMDTDQILDLFNMGDTGPGLISDKPNPMEGREEDMVDVETGDVITNKPGGKKAWMDDLDDLWDNRQYEESFDLDGFLKTMQ
ncbi:hypothetical protein BN1723_000472 [Verticillium longisporum]|uniref:Helicase C-terminal domain-containing protein n=1 Tax=Verticillium longisporum TaxID=100787 RepID=A0A0G4M6B0_VERLO|nr:hypothetical protein BN1723_000472 [Verticillium longisporum]